MPYDDDLQLAVDMADAADAISLAAFRSSGLRVDTKPDMSLVSEADKAVEAMLRERLATTRPDDAIVGEEFGSTVTETGQRRWYLDPIDGTHNYVRGVPVFATLIALVVDGAPVVGVCSAPALQARWWACRGGGAFERGRAIHVSAVRGIDDAHISYDDVRSFEEAGIAEQFLALERRCWRSRGFGDFWQHVMVAEGALDAAIETTVHAWDVAANQVIVEEAGGRLTDLCGRPRFDGGSVVSTNGLVHDDILAALR